MNAFFDYLKYVIRHKWFVFLEARKLRVGLWQALNHDNSKLYPAEFMPYMNRFSKKLTTDAANVKFQIAWLHHIHHNPHHWNHWLFSDDVTGVRVVRMPEKYVREMVADWRGVGRTLGKGVENAKTWYLENQTTIALHPQTRNRVEVLLGITCGDECIQTVPHPTPREPGA